MASCVREAMAGKPNGLAFGRRNTLGSVMKPGFDLPAAGLAAG